MTGWKAQGGLDVLALPSPAQAKNPISLLVLLMLVNVAIITEKRCRDIYAICTVLRVFMELEGYVHTVHVSLLMLDKLKRNLTQCR